MRVRRLIWAGPGGIAVCVAGWVALAAPGCGGNGAVTYLQPFDASAFLDHDVPPSGVGAACSATQPCRQGLSCNDLSMCVADHSSTTGTACVVDDECVPGDVCNGSHVCAASTASDDAGAVATGSSCASDLECASGMRCDLNGLFAECELEGKGDIGDTCATSNDCLGGLFCHGLKCAEAPANTGGPPPLSLSSWAGVACGDDPPPTKPYFIVPRSAGAGAGDGGAGTDFFRLPFPNDIETSGGHPSLTGFPTPGVGVLGYDLIGRYVADLEANADGFSTNATVTLRFSGPVAFGTLNLTNALQWLEFDSTGATPVAFVWSTTTGRSQYVCPNALTARPQSGVPLKPGTTYAFVVSSQVTAADGTAMQMPSDLAALLASSPPSDSALATPYTEYAPLRAWVAANGGASAFIAATVFTTAHDTTLAPAAIAAANAATAPSATGWVNCATAASPCPQATGDRACGAPNASFNELQALATIPIVQSGTEPYGDPTAGGGVTLDPNGHATVVRTEQVCLSLTVPKGTMPSAGWPLVVYAHGANGSYRSHVTSGIAASLAAAKTSLGASTPIAVLGIDQVETGTRRGSSTDLPANLFYNFANPAAARGNVVQGGVDQASLLTLAKSLSLPASLTGSAVSFGSLAFWGQGQGATEGAVALPFVNGYVAAVLSGEGASVTDTLVAKKNPVDTADVLASSLEDGAINVYHPALALVQAALDQADPLNEASLIAAVPPVTGTAKHLFQPYGIGDTYSPAGPQAAFALAARLGLAAPPATVTTPDKIGGLAPVAVPASGNLMVGGKNVTAFVREYQPSGYDGDFVSVMSSDATEDVSIFLADALSGAVPKVGH